MTIPALRAKPLAPRLDPAHPLSGRARFLPAFGRVPGNARDLSTYRNHQVPSATGTAYAPWGPVPTFNGTGQYIEVPDRPGLCLSTWTVAALFRADNVSGSKAILLKGGGNNRNYSLLLFDNLLYTNFTSATGTFKSTPAGTPVVANRWYHGCGTWDGITLRCYQDGIQIATLTPGAACETTTNLLAIGRTGTATVDYFAGAVDAVAVLAGALPAAAVRALALDPFAMVRDRSPPTLFDLATVTSATVYHAGGALSTPAGPIYYAS